MILLEAATTNSWDTLCGICARMLADGASLTGMSYGAFTLLCFGLLLPSAAILFLVSACTSLSGDKPAKIVAKICLALGSVSLAVVVGLLAYALICGSTWAGAA